MRDEPAGILGDQPQGMERITRPAVECFVHVGNQAGAAELRRPAPARSKQRPQSGLHPMASRPE
jgi:hypothetical protein